jgi:uncharacterized protein
MTIVLSGGTGLVGQALNAHFKKKGKKTLIVSRKPAYWANKMPDDDLCDFNTFKTRKLDIEQCEAIIHLSGANVGRWPWTPAYQKSITTSRIDTTRQWATWLCSETQDIPFFCANAVGIYGPQTPQDAGLPPKLDEKSPLGEHGFLAEVGKAWHDALDPLRAAQKPCAEMRFGVVMTPDGGALKRMALPVQVGLGGTIGSGQQPISWIALRDLVHAMDFLLSEKKTGICNLTAPEALTQKAFSKQLAKHLHRPHLMQTPACAVRLLLGNMGQALLLEGQNVYPKILLDLGFKFKYPTFDTFLKKAYP